MRPILVDYARRHVAAKRGSGAPKQPLEKADGALLAVPSIDFDVMMLDAALDRLAALENTRATRSCNL